MWVIKSSVITGWRNNSDVQDRKYTLNFYWENVVATDIFFVGKLM
jgi:hypothetical protein